MELWTGFLVGLVGSLHCIGMCGPIALLLPAQGDRPQWSHVMGRLLYNLGRVVTYSLMGAIFGLLGQAMSLAGFQQWLSIFAGVFILIAVFMPWQYVTRLLPSGSAESGWMGKVKGFFTSLLRNPSQKSLFSLGLLNGILPCGLVYVALGGAIATGDMLMGVAYMALFGLGTVPVMLAVSLVGNFLNIGVRRFLTRMIPIGAVILAAVFILRGLSLGIPYLSPPKHKMEIRQTAKTDSLGMPHHDHKMH